MKTLNNYITERLNPKHLGQAQPDPTPIEDAVKENEMVSDYWKWKVYNGDLTEDEFNTLADLYEPNDNDWDITGLFDQCCIEVGRNFNKWLDKKKKDKKKKGYKPAFIDEYIDDLGVDDYYFGLFCKANVERW
jgi:hypothetical protein